MPYPYPYAAAPPPPPPVAEESSGTLLLLGAIATVAIVMIARGKASESGLEREARERADELDLYERGRAAEAECEAARDEWEDR